MNDNEKTEDIMDFVEPKDYLVESRSVQRREAVQKKRTMAILDALIDKTKSGAFDDKFEDEKIREAMNSVHGYNTFAFNQHSWIGKDPVEFRQFLYALVKSGYKSRQQETESRSVQKREAVQNERERIPTVKNEDKIREAFELNNPNLDLRFNENTKWYYSNSTNYAYAYQLALKQSQQEISTFAKLVIEYDKQIEELQEALDRADLEITKLRSRDNATDTGRDY